MRQILACLLLATLGRTSFAGACAVPEAVVVVLTPPGSELDDTGGAVVALGPRTDDDQTKMDDIARLRWHFQGEGAVSKIIAPGLAVVTSTQHGEALENSVSDVKLHVTWRHAKPPLPAPRVKSLVFSENHTPHGSWSGTMLSLDAAPPADAVAVLVNTVDNPLAQPAWSRITDPKATTIALDARPRCAWVIPGNVMPAAGTKVAVSWLDTSGRISPASKPVTIALPL